MLGEAGYFTALPKPALDGMIDVVKGIEPEMGYGAILQLSEVEAAMRESRTKKTKTVCTYCGVGCSFDVWTQDRHILKVEPAQGAANGISTCVKGKFGWDYVNSRGPADEAADSRGGKVPRGDVGRGAGPGGAEVRRDQGGDGPDALAFISSSKCTNEESYLMQKLARAVIGTNNMDNCSRYCQAPATIGLVPHGGLRRRFGIDLGYRAGRIWC